MEILPLRKEILWHDTTKVRDVLCCVSGGRSSALLAIHLATSPRYSNWNICYCFANTGLERKETVEFLMNLEQFIGKKIHVVEGVYSDVYGVGIRHKEVSFANLSMDGSPMYEVIRNANINKNAGVFHSGYPYCSSHSKERPMHSFAKDYFGHGKYIRAIGLRYEDFPKRVLPMQWKKVFDHKAYPLLSDFCDDVTVPFLDDFWSKMPFQLGIKSRYTNCTLCFKKSTLNLLETIKMDEKVADWYRQMEMLFGNTFFRENRSTDDLIKMSRERFPDDIDREDFPCLCG